MIFRRGNILDWDIARELLKPAFGKAFQVDTIDDYLPALKMGVVQLWIAEDDKVRGAVLTAFDQGSNGKVMHIRFLGGKKLKIWIAEMENILTEFARENGCKQVEAVTRKGFSRYAKQFKAQKEQLFIKVIHG